MGRWFMDYITYIARIEFLFISKIIDDAARQALKIRIG
jgi:hypothetical protein